MNKPVAIVLGGAIAHVNLVKNLNKRGYYTILVDYYENPPAREFACEHICKSALDKEFVLQLAKERKAGLIITLCLDLTIPTACYVSETLSLPAPYDYQTALNVTDKSRMKQILINNHIPTARFISLEDKIDYKINSLAFPVVVKPADSTGSQGVRIAEKNEEVTDFIKQALLVSKSKKVIVEEFIEGRELNVHCAVIDKEPEILLIVEKKNIFDYETKQHIFVGSQTIPNLSDDKLILLKRLLKKTVRSFNLVNTPLLIQLIERDNEFIIIELAARVGGGLAQNLIRLKNNINFIDYAINLYIGRDTFININNKNRNEFATILIYSYPGIFSNITGVEELIDQGTIIESHAYVNQGFRIPNGLSSKNRVGSLIVMGNIHNELFEKRNIAQNIIDVIDVSGRSLYRKFEQI